MKRWIILILLVIPIVSAIDINIGLEKDNIPSDSLLNANITLIDSQERENVPLFVEYFVVGSKNNTVVKDSRTLILDGKINYVKSIYLSPSLKPDDYKLIIHVVDEEKLYTSSKYFSLYESKWNKVLRYINLIVFLFILMVAIMVLILVNMQRNSLRYINKKLDSRLNRIYEDFINSKRKEEAINKLKKQLSLLTKAYKNKYITKKTYMRSKQRISKYITKIRRNRKV